MRRAPSCIAAVSDRSLAPSGRRAVWSSVGAGLAKLDLTTRTYTFSYPFPPEEVVEFFRLYYGPTNQAFAALDASGQNTLRRELEALWSAHNRSGHGSTTVMADYLEVIGIRR